MRRDYRQQLISLMAALVLMAITPCLTACQGNNDDSSQGQTVDVKRYINLSVTVSGGKNATRAAGDKPAAGEDGDGREAGFERENKVNGITLILYKDANGINTDADPAIDFVAYYETTQDAEDKTVYTTGDRLVTGTTFDVDATYHGIVVANEDLTSTITTSSKLSDVRDMVMRKELYSYDGGAKTADKANDFIMSSEKDFLIKLEDAYLDKTVPSKIVYRYSGIRIERLAARIDFWAVNGTYKETKKGYEYDVEGSATDKFVVTGVTPFNINSYNTTNGGEYLIKRLTDEIKDGYKVTYLADETAANYVVDPATTTKTDGNLTYFKNQLAADLSTITTYDGTDFYRSMVALNGTIGENGGGVKDFEDDGKIGDNLVVCYPMENTLWKESLLYNYATGLAVEGDYYTAGILKDHRIYYGYLRHNGSSSSAYQAYKGSEMSKTATVTSANAMEYGIVRNNIYRVFISKIKKDEVTEEPKITLGIKVKNWDVFIHKPIWM